MTHSVAEHGLLRKIVAVMAGAILLVLGLMFSVVLLAVISVVALTAFGYFWWKTRGLRKAMRERPENGQVIEGEAVIVEEYPVSERHLLPDDPNKL
ncbi:MAG: hypothetical protein NTY41_08740 [Proteobacteria bacterium]|nr:hypothetical protein [Pseudomonadota bacterium]